MRLLVQIFVLCTALPLALLPPAKADVAYVALRNSGVVAAVDLATGETLHRIEVGAIPRSLTGSRDGSRMFVINEADLTVSVIDTGDHTVVDTIAIRELAAGEAGLTTGDIMENLAVGNVSDAFFLVGFYSGAVRVDLSGAEPSAVGMRTATDLMHNPGGILEFSADGQSIYLMNDPNLLVLDAATLRPTGRIPSNGGFNGSSQFRVSPDGTLAVSDDDYSRFTFADLARFTSENVTIPLAGSGIGSRGMAFSSDGRSLYRARGDGVVSRIDVASRSVEAASEPDMSHDGLAVSPDGRFVVAINPRRNLVHVLDGMSLQLLRSITLPGNPTANVDFVVGDGAVRPPRSGASDAMLEGVRF